MPAEVVTCKKDSDKLKQDVQIYGIGYIGYGMAKVWRIKFNAEKCEVMCFVGDDERRQYCSKRDVGAKGPLNVTGQVEKVVHKENKTEV